MSHTSPPQGEEKIASDIRAVVSKEDWFTDGLIIIVVGASGDLAKKKTYPSLLNLYNDGLLPSDTVIWGFARSSKTHSELREQIRPFLEKQCTSVPEDVLHNFLQKCYYKIGKTYGDEEAWLELVSHMEGHESQFPHRIRHNRLFYLATPPNVFSEAGAAIKKCAMASHNGAWSRLVVEKPFGRDLQTCEELSHALAEHFDEYHLYRIDHYLGKEVVQNLLIFRFGNSVYERLWNRRAIQSVHLVFKEPFGTEGRGGYFDNYGIVRDILQNHLLQVLMLLAMEPPTEVDTPAGGDYIRDAKTRVLLSMPPIELEDTLLGQYEGYNEDPTIKNKDTNCPTYAALRCRIHTPRWDGVPFVMEAGKALDERLCEIRIHFRPPPAAAYMFPTRKLASDMLVMRLQPDPSIYFTSNIKSPGFAHQPVPVRVGVDYRDLMKSPSPDAYTRLILDVLRGRQGSFVRSDELRKSWEIFTPLLHEIESTAVRPLSYTYGSTGPVEREAFMKKHRIATDGGFTGPKKANL